jgi:hypothetical protein
MADFSVQRITGTSIVEVSTTHSDFKSATLTNNHHIGTPMIVSMWVTDQYGNDIADTGVNVNAAVGYAAGTSSTAVTVDGGSFTDATCDYNNDPTIAHDDDSGAIKVGMQVFGTGIPAAAIVASVTSDTSFELSASTTGGSVTNGTLTFLPIILNEKLWKSDGTLIGAPTAVSSATSITFGDGLSQDLVDNDDMYASVYHYFLRNTKIPGGTSLKLEDSDIYLPPNLYKLWVSCDSCTANNPLDITIRR